jgi:hydroxymethylglutaryl-CoA lyase
MNQAQAHAPASDIDILVSEVGPRDGLQSIATVMPTAAKKAWISAEAAAGVREIEVGSFVPAKLLPQLADTAELVAHALTIKGLSVAVLVPNFKGAQRAIECGAHKITLPLSCSESHSLKNLRRTHAQVLDEARAIGELLRSLPEARRPCFEGALSTAFGCTIEGVVPEAKVVELAEALMAAGCNEVGLSDTTGYANPTQVRSLTRAVWAAVGRDRLTGLHLHNTRGLGLANVPGRLRRRPDARSTPRWAGIGGCPFAPGASRQRRHRRPGVLASRPWATATGIDIDRLLAVRRLVQAALPGEMLYGFVPDAGLPKTFLPAAAKTAA